MTLDALARRYGVRPSSFVSGLRPVQALTLDYRAMVAGAEAEVRMARDRGR